MRSLHREALAFLSAGVVVCVSVVALTAQGATPLSGTWTMNVAKSKFNPPDLAPKSGTSRLDVSPDGITVVTDGVDSKGRKTTSKYTAKFGGPAVSTNGTVDGKPNPDQDAAAWKKIDDYTYETVNSLKGKTLTTNHVSVARDGKTRTLTVTGRNAQGQTVNNTIVYEKP